MTIEDTEIIAKAPIGTILNIDDRLVSVVRSTKACGGHRCIWYTNTAGCIRPHLGSLPNCCIRGSYNVAYVPADSLIGDD